jgi:hypothetical protein
MVVERLATPPSFKTASRGRQTPPPAMVSLAAYESNELLP